MLLYDENLSNPLKATVTESLEDLEVTSRQSLIRVAVVRASRIKPEM